MSKVGPPDYPEATRIAQAFVKAAPERLVWGSDWPNLANWGEKANKINASSPEVSTTPAGSRRVLAPLPTR